MFELVCTSCQGSLSCENTKMSDRKKITVAHIQYLLTLFQPTFGEVVSTEEMFCVGVAAFDHEMYNLECKKFLSFSRQVEEDKTTTQETNLLSCVGGLNSWEERIL